MMKVKHLSELLFVVVLVGLLTAVFFPVLSGKTFLHTGVVYSDLMLFNYPLKDWYREMLVSGRLPFWTSLLGNGFPVFAELQIGALYPFHLLWFRVLPTLLAFNLNLFLHFVFAAIFTYLFCRISLAQSKSASVISGLVYSLSGFFLTHIHQINIILVVAYLPLVLLAVERLVTTRKAVFSFSLALVFVFQILAGYIEMFYYTVLISAVFFVSIGVLFPEVRGQHRKQALPLKTGLFFAVAIALGMGMSAVQLLPTFELTQLSQRAEGLGFEAAAATAWPLDTFRLFVFPRAYDLFRSEPGYHPLVSQTVNIQALYGYVGLLPLLFGLGAIAKGLKKRFVVVFAILLIGSIVYGLGRTTQLFGILWETLPGLKFFRYPVKILFFIDFCLAILAGFGFDDVRGFLARRIGRAEGGSKVLQLFSALAVGLVFIDLFYNNVRQVNLSTSGKEWFSSTEAAEFLSRELSDSGYRVYSHGTNNLDYQYVRDVGLQKEFQNLMPVDFSLLSRIPSNREWFALLLPRQQLLNGERTILDPKEGVLRLSSTFKRSLGLQSVKFLLADLPIEDKDLALRKTIPFSKTIDHYAYLSGDGGVQTVTVPARATYIYEYSGAYPRVLFVDSARAVRGGEEALEAIMDPAFDLRTEVVLEVPEAILPSTGSGTGTASITDDRENSLEVAVQSASEGYLVLADTFYPGWTATVDGTSMPILRANYAFRAIKVPAGEHRVVFSFEPTYWKLGLIISAVTLLITLCGLTYTLLAKR